LALFALSVALVSASWAWFSIAPPSLFALFLAIVT